MSESAALLTPEQKLDRVNNRLMNEEGFWETMVDKDVKTVKKIQTNFSQNKDFLFAYSYNVLGGTQGLEERSMNEDTLVDAINRVVDSHVPNEKDYTHEDLWRKLYQEIGVQSLVNQKLKLDTDRSIDARQREIDSRKTSSIMSAASRDRQKARA